MDNKIAIKINNISKIYPLYNKPSDRVKEVFSIRHKCYHKDFPALKPLSIDIIQGECFGIIGVNGSGKSTLLKMITGVLTPTTGNFEINGRVSALLELGAGFNGEFTGMENIYMNGTVMGYSRAEMDKIIPSILEFADIGDFIYQPVKTYSSGMFARLAFAVAINVDPDILIVDEALSVGDIYFQAKCFAKFDEFKAKGKTIIFITHDMSCVLKYCDRVMVLNKGEFIADGTPDEMVDIYKQILSNQFHGLKNKSNQMIEKKMDENTQGNKWSSLLVKNPKPTIYGDKEVEIIDYAIVDDRGRITNTVTKGKPFDIKVVIKLHEDVKDIIVAQKIKSTKGEELEGTNTMYENVNLNEASKGDIVTVNFHQATHLQPGQYLLSLGCTKFMPEGLHIFHRLYDITSIDVIGKKTTVGTHDPDSEVTFSIKKS